MGSAAPIRHRSMCAKQMERLETHISKSSNAAGLIEVGNIHIIIFKGLNIPSPKVDVFQNILSRHQPNVVASE